MHPWPAHRCIAHRLVQDGLLRSIAWPVRQQGGLDEAGAPRRACVAEGEAAPKLLEGLSEIKFGQILIEVAAFVDYEERVEFRIWLERRGNLFRRVLFEDARNHLLDSALDENLLAITQA